jgi:hypothetical protein
VSLPEAREAPRDEQELRELVAWMRSLGHEELLLCSNAEFGFRKSELVELLKNLRGPWVVPALGELALSETDPLIQAILVEGLVFPAGERIEDERMLPILDRLIFRMRAASADPWDVAGGLAAMAYMASGQQEQDYVSLMAAHLALSDNPKLLTEGYLFMNDSPGAEPLLAEMLRTHPSPEGRMGALEGLRNAAVGGRVAPEQVTALGLEALAGETNERNRLLLYEMLASAGGEAGLDALEGMVRGGEATELPKMAELVAMKMEPNRALALFQDVLRERELGGEEREAVYRALGLVPGDEGQEVLLGLVRDEALPGEERLAGLRGLWGRELDEGLAEELQSVFEDEEDTALRTEALRMLVYGEDGGAGVDLRAAAVLDRDPAVRAEALQLAALEPGDDTRDWLEERLLEDDSLDVKASALGALVYHAHYAGDGEQVLGYLERARKFTDDEHALAMIAQGERMVREHDPRRVELGLAEEAAFWKEMTRYTSGPAQRAFERRGRQLERVVGALRASAR